MFRDHVLGLDAQVTSVFDGFDEHDDGQGIEAQRGIIRSRTMQLTNERADEIQALIGGHRSHGVRLSDGSGVSAAIRLRAVISTLPLPVRGSEGN